MNPKNYLTLELNNLKEPVSVELPRSSDDLVDCIVRMLTSKKFRKYSINDEFAKHLRDSVAACVASNEPIRIVFFGGCYKLWRLDEAPEADWAELFSYLYYTRWMKPICAIYKPGVWFDFLLDDYIVPRLNNISEADMQTYRSSRDAVLEFVKPYQPINLNMTHTSEGALFESRAAYDESLERAVRELANTFPDGLPTLSASEAAAVELNTKATAEQLDDPKWREKVELLHSAYYNARSETSYYSPEAHKIIAFTQPFAPGRPLAVGSTKDTIAKYWVGVGALKPEKDSFRQMVLSPNQLANAQYVWSEIQLAGLSGKNFSRIRILK